MRFGGRLEGGCLEEMLERYMLRIVTDVFMGEYRSRK